MGNYRRLLLLQLPFSPPSPLLPSVSLQFHNEFQSSGISPLGGDPIHLSWRKGAAGPNSIRRLRYNFRDEVFAEGGDDRYDGGGSKKRVWWLEDDAGEDDEDEGSRNELPIFKVMSALGWMVPAMAVSLLVGTDQNALVMALAVPLVQTAVSLVLDKLWGRSTYARRPRARPWTKTRRPFNRTTSRTQTRERKRQEEEEEVDSETGSGNGNGYQSWVASEGGSCKKTDTKGPRFGGWDELDGASDEAPPPKTTGIPNRRKADGSRKQGNRVRMSRPRRVRNRPLLLRLLVSVFPFMSAWSWFLL